MTGDVLRIDSLIQIEDRVSQWRKRFGEHGLEALEEITFNDLPTNDTASRSWWCEWALSTGDETCRPYYYSTYNEPEDEESQLKAKVLFTLRFTLLCHSLLKLFLLGHFSIPTHRCHIRNTRRMVIPHRRRGPLQEEANWSTCSFNPSRNSTPRHTNSHLADIHDI